MMQKSTHLEKSATHQRLKTALEVRTRRYLWIESDAITFVPPVLSTVYGDGRALFALTTINNRPAFWVIRCDSQWSCGLDFPGRPWAPDSSEPPDFGDFTDEILTDLELEFGTARCGYSGANLYLPRRYRDCKCDECRSEPLAEWPMVDCDGGCSWGRLSWPNSFPIEQHPWHKYGLLAT